MSKHLAPTDTAMEVRSSDVLRTDLSCIPEFTVPALYPQERIRLNWIMGPSNAGSGGHTTAFRIINYLETHGYRNQVYFYDVYGGDHRYYSGIVRDHFTFQGPIGRVEDGMEDAHGLIATSWSTAYPAVNATCTGRRFYFVQDFEPFFYPVGTASTLAENTYRMGFYGITAGRWLSQKLRSEFRMQADHFDFGCDTSTYHRIPDSQRNGVVFYARPGTPRRGFELGLMAIEVLASRRPGLQIHLYGSKMGKLPFSFIDHGTLTPRQLNLVYNQCYAGLSLSMTNVSLVPHEMLAAGCIPVINDAHHNRIVLDNHFVRYASTDPHALASALEDVIDTPDFAILSEEASRSVRSASWEDAGNKVDSIIRNALNELQPSAPSLLPVSGALMTRLDGRGPGAVPR
jgi:O-antigen biosynthesis protein